MAKNNIEQQVADTMLQAPHHVTIGNKEYEVAPPSFGTLMKVSELLARVPEIDDLSKANAGEKAAVMLQKARDFGVLPELLAVLILGSKHINDREQVVTRTRARGLRGFFGLRDTKVEEVPVYYRLVNEIRDEVSPQLLSDLVPWLISGLQLADFFVLTTFLREIRLTEPTKVGTKATARGRSSQASSKVST